MLVLKYNKNLIIEAGQVLIPQVRRKGMYICVKGKLTNRGTISMTARGANAVGENVYLIKNSDNSYEYIPEEGEAGGLGIDYFPGYAESGENGTNRRTGGGRRSFILFRNKEKRRRWCSRNKL